MLTLIPEANIIKKDWRRVDLKIGLCYPNVYRAGMSGLTIRLLYALFNIRDDVLCERFFVPTRQEPWISLESGQPLSKFDVVAFTLQYEEDYVNVIRMLLKSGIPIRRE
ncbi:MAG: radical SAM protein, partial [Candidatus Bathyarchaeia archaeon]